MHSRERETTLSTSNLLQPGGSGFRRLIHATIGENRIGSDVTFLSIFSRLRQEAWVAAANPVSLGREAAASRMGLLRSRFGFAPAFRRDIEPVVRDPARLPTEPPTPAAAMRGSGRKRPPTLSGTNWVVLAVILVLIEVIFAGIPGSRG